MVGPPPAERGWLSDVLEHLRKHVLREVSDRYTRTIRPSLRWITETKGRGHEGSFNVRCDSLDQEIGKWCIVGFSFLFFDTRRRKQREGISLSSMGEVGIFKSLSIHV